MKKKAETVLIKNYIIIITLHTNFCDMSFLAKTHI